MWIGEAEWFVAEFGGNIPLLKNDPIFDQYYKSLEG